jgi:parvulin-like peptidyl-prolyl isomerase
MSDRQQPNIVTKKHLDRLHRERRQTRMILIGVGVAVLAVVALLVYGYLDSSVLRYKKPVAIVNGERIMGEDFRGYTKYYRYSLIRQAESSLQIMQMFGSDPNMLQQFAGQLQNYDNEMIPNNAGKSALNQMIDSDLIKQEAKKRGITVTEEEIEKRWQETMDYFPNGTPTPTSTSAPVATSTLNPTQVSMMKPTATATLPATAAPVTTTAGVTATVVATPTATLEATELPTPTGPITPTATPTTAPTATPYTLEGYQGAVATMKAELFTTYGIPEETLRWIVETSLYREKLQEQIVGQLPCSQEQVWAQHILMSDPTLAATIAQEAKAGKDWYELAAQYSTDSTKDNGGDLGWFARGAMVKEFEDAAFSMEVGQISDPVKSQFGYHIIRIMGKETRPLTGQECERYKQSEFQKFVDELHTNAQIETRDDYWQMIVPVTPVFPPEIQQVIDQFKQQQQAPAQPPNPAP